MLGKKLKFFLFMAALLCLGTACSDSQVKAKTGSSQTTEIQKKNSEKKKAEERQKKEQAITTEAIKYLGVPYKWGGKTPEGFDCSGLVQYVYKNALGIETGSTVVDQEKLGKQVSLTALKSGDLLFWYGAHDGIYLGNDEFIHSPTIDEVVKKEKISDLPEDSKPDSARRIF